MKPRHFLIVLSYLLIAGVDLIPVNVYSQGKSGNNDLVIVNFDKSGHQVIRYSSIGDAVDAHDGEIALFDGTYYLYGTSYDCGFEWQNKNAAFCGFKVYASKDLQNWTDRGYLFDARTKIWQTRCNGNTYGCFRPHVIYNKRTRRYVLWINVYDNVTGYRVFTSIRPTGPFKEAAEPKLAVNSTAPAGGLNNGDHDTFVDDDGTAYLAYTDWRSKGSIVIEKLNAEYLSGTGEVCRGVTRKSTEAPGMFKRNGLYYVVYSDPNCGYCSGTGASYKVAKSPLGPWSEGKKISDNSCGGQPSFVSTIKIDAAQVYLFGSDLWNNGAKNEALANYYWSPLTFNKDGSIIPIDCSLNYRVTGKKILSEPSPVNQEGSFWAFADIQGNTKRLQTFISAQTGILEKVDIPLYKTGSPDSGLKVEISAFSAQGKADRKILFTTTLASKNIGWSVRKQILKPKISLTKGMQYCIILSSAASIGNYGYTYDLQSSDTPGYYFGKIAGDSVSIEPGKRINFNLKIDPPK